MAVERKLVVRDGDKVREVLLVGTVTVGRSPTCEISSADPRLSRTHAAFEVVGSDVFVRDLESSNGTTVNGERITEHRLSATDTVEVGPFEVKLVVTETQPARDDQKLPGDDSDATIMRPRHGMRGAGAAPSPPAASHDHAPAVVVHREPEHAPAYDDVSEDATILQKRPTARPRTAPAPAPLQTVAPEPRPVHREPAPVPVVQPVAASRPAVAELSFARSVLLWVVPLALVSFLAGLAPSLFESDERAPLLHAHYTTLAAGAADLVRTTGERGVPIDSVPVAMRRHTGVTNARIIGADGRVLAPLSEAGTSVSVPKLSGSTPLITETAEGLVDVHMAATTADGRPVVIALAVNPESIRPAPAGSAIGTVLLIACLGASWLVARRLTTVTDTRLSRLGEEMELMTTGQVRETRDPFTLPGSRRIIDALTFALSPAGRRQSGTVAPVQQRQEVMYSGGGATACIEADAAFRVLSADAGCETLLGLKAASATGMHLIDALSDQAVADEVLRLLALATPDQPAHGEAAPEGAKYRLGIDVQRGGGRAPLTIRFERL